MTNNSGTSSAARAAHEDIGSAHTEGELYAVASRRCRRGPTKAAVSSEVAGQRNKLACQTLTRPNRFYRQAFVVSGFHQHTERSTLQ